MSDKSFPPDTAGGKIITSFPRALMGETIGGIERILIEKAKSFETLDYVYVVDSDNMLYGVVSVKEILGNAKKDVKVEEVMERDLVVVHPLTKQERLVYRAISHNLKAIPVVDDRRRLLGIVPYDTILRIFNEEVHEDVFKFGGIFHKVGKEFTTVQSSASVMIKRRLPWLIVGVLGGAVTASIVSGFEDVLSSLISLAAFAPVLAYLSDAVGTQSETLAVRSMALDPKVSLKGYLIREIKVAFSLALICGLLITGVAAVGWRNQLLGVIVGASMFLSILAAVFISTFLPFLFRKLDLDPAVASGPFATMVSDVATMAIYFSVASALIARASLLP